MNDNNKYKINAESRISKIFDSGTVDLEVISKNIKFIYYAFIEKCSDETIDKFIKFSINFLNYSHKRLIEDYEKFDEQNKSLKNQIEIVSNLQSQYIRVIMNLSDGSIEFGKRFLDGNGLNEILNYITDETIVSLLVKNNSDDDDDFKFTFSCYIMTILNLSKAYDKYKDQWININAFEKLFDLSKRIEDKENKLRLSMTFANIATDHDLQDLFLSPNIFEELTNLIKRFSNALANKIYFLTKSFKRELFQIEKNKPRVEIIQESSGKNLYECLQALYKFLINDNLKTVFYFKFQIKDTLKKIIYNGNETEQEFAFKALNQLCFDKSIAEDLNNDKNLFKFMNDLALKKKETNKNLVKNINGVFWLLNGETKKIKTLNKSSKHIFISYNAESMEPCLKIKTFLESSGHKCWIDVENKRGELLETMAEGIETSWCALICITAKYKESSYCRMELQYVLKKRTPFIPIIMESSYNPDGW